MTRRLARKGAGVLAAAILAVLLPLAAHADSAFTVQAGIEPPGPVTDTEPIHLVLRISGKEMPDLTVPRMPTLTNLRVVSGPNTASQFSWTNGQASASSSLTYVLLAEKPGRAEIPAIQLKIGSATYRTEPISFDVVRGTTGPRAGGSAPAPGAAPQTRRETGTGPDAFLEAKLGASEIWVGQPVSISVTLFASGVEVSAFNWREIPPYSGFWTEDVTVNPNTERYRTTVEGKAYMAYPIEKKILMPTAAGDLTIEPYAAQVQVRRSSGDLFNDFFSFGRTQEVIRKTEPLRLHVKKLPEAGRPADFGGAVGTFKLTSSIDRKEAQVNDAVALKVTVQGEGFLKSASAPRIDVPPDVKLFEPKVNESSATNAGKVLSRKTWEWVLVPLVPGEIHVPPPSFSYFDPEGGAYRTLEAPPITIVAKKAERGGDETVARGEVRLQRREIAFIKPLRGRLEDQGARTHQRPWFLAALLAPLLWAPAIILLGRRRARLKHDVSFARAGRARSRARKRLRSTERRMAGLDAGVFHEEVARALVEYVADRFDRPPAGLTYEVADNLLESRGAPADLRGRFRACLERCDFARFVPDAGREAAKAEVLKEANDLVDLLERAL